MNSVKMDENWLFLLTATEKTGGSCCQMNYVHIFNELTNEAHSTLDLWYYFYQNEELAHHCRKKRHLCGFFLMVTFEAIFPRCSALRIQTMIWTYLSHWRTAADAYKSNDFIDNNMPF